jgi:predicted enzyme related to lactoylglutathione lyase
MGVRQIVPPTKVEGVGRFVFLQDPQGAHVAFIQIDQDRA